MGYYEDLYLSKRPQELCLMCGKCCRVVCTPNSYKELLDMAQNGDEGSIDFLNIFEPYNSVEETRLVDSEIVDNILFHKKENGETFDENDITFYKCKYLKDDNSCGNYQNRPTLCRHFPSTPWAVVPPGCGFSGWLFLKREEDKARVRKAKEELLSLKLKKSKTNNPEIISKIELVENKLNDIIAMYHKYGSKDW